MEPAGIQAYSLVVVPLGKSSTLAGASALGVIVLPLIARPTEESPRPVPDDLREAALALGIPRWRTTLSVVHPTASAGLVTGALPAVARAARETEPPIFTALANRSWHDGLLGPIAARALPIFEHAISPSEEWN